MYLMESADETRRLLAQEQANDSRQAMLLTGVKPGDRALDAGCGPGLLAETLAELVGSSGQVTGLDLSSERLAVARERCLHRPNLRFLQTDISNTGLAEGSFDYTWSQFVFQYLGQRKPALEELVRVTRPGGKVVVSEIDGLGLQNWPFSEALHEGTLRIANVLATHGFDLFVGRKMHGEFLEVGLRDVRVHLLPFYVCAGEADARMVMDWETRFAALEAVAAPAFGGRESYRAHCQDYMRMLADPMGLKYAILLVTEGTKP
jgi:SAM-dependent methyltransferase